MSWTDDVVRWRPHNLPLLAPLEKVQAQESILAVRQSFRIIGSILGYSVSVGTQSSAVGIAVRNEKMVVEHVYTLQGD